MKSDKIVVSLQENTISHRGRSVRLTPTLAELAYVLARSAPKPVSQARICIGLWSAQDGPANETAIVSYHICRLRKKIHTLGLAINLARGVGYYITAAEDATTPPPPRVTWSDELIEQYSEMRRQNLSREQILDQLGLTPTQLRSFHNFLRARRRFPYLFPPSSVDLRRAPFKLRRQKEEAAP
jgi:DNA-binding winged helix-turn-helix (wHTH) protein